MIFGKKKTDSESIREKIQTDILQDIVNKQNKELIELRWAAQNYKELKEKKQELDALIKEHTRLCKEAREQITEYQKLNMELTSTIAECKKSMREAIELSK